MAAADLKNRRELHFSTLGLPSAGEQSARSYFSVNSTDPEAIDHHAAKVLTTFYGPAAEALQSGIKMAGCRPPSMVVAANCNFHEHTMTVTRAAVDKAPASTAECIRKYSGAVRGGRACFLGVTYLLGRG